MNAHAGSGGWDDDLNNIEQVYLVQGEFLIGEYQGRPVAMGALKPGEPGTGRAEIKRMRVHPDFQRRGYGQSILTELEHRARQAGYTCLYLDTTVGQTPAQQLYLKNGFTNSGQVKILGFDCFQFEKKLSS